MCAHDKAPWQIMCVVFVKDLGGTGFLYRVSKKCQNHTTVAELQHTVEKRLAERAPGREFSEAQVLTPHSLLLTT